MAVIGKARMGMIAVAAVTLVPVARRLMRARRLSSGMMALVVAGSAGAADITGCTVISAPGIYNIVADITDGTTTYCIDIQADDVILDGGGHLIDGVTATAFRSGIRAMRINVPDYNITIRNVEITNFDSGISILGWGSGKFTDEDTSGCTYLCGTQQLLGDLNGEDKITSADAAIALQMAVRGEYSEMADVSGDDIVTSLDALMILQAVDQEGGYWIRR